MLQFLLGVICGVWGYRMYFEYRAGRRNRHGNVWEDRE